MPTPGRLKVGRSQVQSNPACPASSRLGSALEKIPLKANKIHLLLGFFFPTSYQVERMPLQCFSSQGYLAEAVTK